MARRTVNSLAIVAPVYKSPISFSTLDTSTPSPSPSPGVYTGMLSHNPFENFSGSSLDVDTSGWSRTQLSGYLICRSGHEALLQKERAFAGLPLGIAFITELVPAMAAREHVRIIQ